MKWNFFCKNGGYKRKRMHTWITQSRKKRLFMKGQRNLVTSRPLKPWKGLRESYSQVFSTVQTFLYAFISKIRLKLPFSRTSAYIPDISIHQSDSPSDRCVFIISNGKSGAIVFKNRFTPREAPIRFLLSYFVLK